jgi:hypothetical protein
MQKITLRLRVLRAFAFNPKAQALKYQTQRTQRLYLCLSVSLCLNENPLLSCFSRMPQKKLFEKSNQKLYFRMSGCTTIKTIKIWK